MIPLMTTAHIRAAEAYADAQGVSYAVMMERAGRAIADRINHYARDLENPAITVLVGKGNNGGDGLVAGLLVAQDNEHARVRFYLLENRAQDDPLIAIAVEAGLFIAVSENDSDKRLLKNMIASADIVVDALFGIGVRLPLRDEAQRLLRTVNQALRERRAEVPPATTLDPDDPLVHAQRPQITVIAVDVPSGLDADSGVLDRLAIAADETITFIGVKPGILTGDGVTATGKLMIAPLDLPRPKDDHPQQWLIDGNYARSLLPARTPDSNKGTYGKAMIVAGAAQYYGAPLLASEAAYRVGAGLVTLATPMPIIQAMASRLPEVTWLPLSEGAAEQNAVSILAHLEGYTALLIGCGLGTSDATHALLMGLLQKTGLPACVLDADALNLLAQQPEWWTIVPPHSVITPHPGEMARLCAMTTPQVQANRLQLAADSAKKWGQIIVLKGAHTLIAHPDGRLAISPFKTDALAKAGTGDILAGMIAGLIAQGIEPFAAAQLACYVHGLAGRQIAQTTSSRSVIATDILAQLGNALATLEHIGGMGEHIF